MLKYKVLSYKQWQRCCLVPTSSVMAALVGGYFAFKWLNQQHLKEKLLTATQDISFLLEVERLYIENSRINGKVTSVGKYKIRAQARRNGYKWSGMFTPGRVSLDIKQGIKN